MPMMRRGMGRTRRRRRRRRVRRRRILLVGGLVAFGAYKMSQRDAERVEQHTGVPPEEMTDEELEQAMTDLDIEHQKVDASDREDTGAGSSGSGGGGMDYLDELERLAKLKDEGVLTEDEFEAKKRQILGL